MNSINKIIIPLLLLVAIAGCKDSFLDRPSESQISSNNFYQTTSDLRLATANLYGGAAWWNWQGQTDPWLELGDVLSGNGFVGYYDQSGDLYAHSISAQNSILSTGWAGLYNVIAQCNSTITGINQYTASSISATDKNAAIAEAKFVRGVAYYYLAIYWGAVPIIEDNSTLIQNPLLKRNIVTDVYKFITNDLTYAAQNLPTTDVAGRVTTWSAQGMLGKVYLTMAGLGQTGGTRNQAYLDSAKLYAGNVCKNSGIELYHSYSDLFKAQFNDVPEDLFALQWAPGTGWGKGNALQTLAPNLGDIQGWSSMNPSYDLYQLYTSKDTVRRKATFMLKGDYYPELNAAAGGYTAGGQTLKKHIIGNAKDNNSPTMDIWSSIEHTALLRLADVYLIYAEAILGNNATTANADALLYFNKVRTRAGVDPDNIINIDSIYKERRIELAFEGQLWPDLVRLSYYNPDKALNFVNSQQSVTFSYSKGVATPGNGTTGAPANVVPATISSFTLQIPASELSTDPKLADPAVPYYK